jgi:hypothetical protein
MERCKIGQMIPSPHPTLSGAAKRVNSFRDENLLTQRSWDCLSRRMYLLAKIEQEEVTHSRRGLIFVYFGFRHSHIMPSVLHGTAVTGSAKLFQDIYLSFRLLHHLVVSPRALQRFLELFLQPPPVLFLVHLYFDIVVTVNILPGLSSTRLSCYG